MKGILILLILVAVCALAVYYRIKYPSKYGSE
jgi:hypothetical protein